jgi:hypothetical protein
MSALELTWPNGIHATLVEVDGDKAVVESGAAAAPGTPLALMAPRLGAQLQIKVRGCRKLSDEPLTFRIEGRFVNLSGAQRSALLAAFNAG